MNGTRVKEVVRAALQERHDAICDHIAAGYAKKPLSTKGIEGVFENAFKAELPCAPIGKRATLEGVGAKQPEYSGRKKGWIDIYLPELHSGFELKAVRLPRT